MQVDKPDQLFCCIRHNWVAALPEEIVRQQLIQRMTQELGYPLSGFALEKSLQQMPHLALSSSKMPARRADLVFFAKGIHPQYDLYPLLLIECKAIPLAQKVLRQVIGYNFYVQAPFLAVANQTEVRLGWYEKQSEEYLFVPDLLPYGQLMAHFRSLPH